MTLPRLCPPRPRTVLAAGRAPSCWQQQVRPASTAPRALARLCGWMDGLAHAPGPRLRREPLFGTCLAELVSDTPAGERPAGEPALAPRQARPVQPSPDKRHPAAVPQPPPAAGQRRPAATPATGTPHRAWPGHALPGHGRQRATPEMLARLAGHGAKGGPRLRGSGKRPAFAPPGQSAPTAMVTPPASAPAWADRLAERVRRALASPAGGHAATRASGRLPAPAERPDDLATQWRAALAGQRLPAGWLAATLATRPPVTRSPGAPPIAPQARPGREPDLMPRPADGSGPQPAQPPARRPRRHNRPAARALARPIPAGGDSDGWVGPGPDVDGASHRNGRLEADSGEVVSVVNRFAPPQTADTLPPARPPVGQSAVAMPVAAAAARRSARREEAAAGEAADDLDELAGKLRRILEEESRRHGIDI